MVKASKVRALVALTAICAISTVSHAQNTPAANRKTKTVVLIVADGLRWQEIFTGAEQQLMGEHGGLWADSAALAKRFWRDDVGERRALLFPFLWGTVAKRGQIFGNQTKGSIAHVTNGLGFSYPGYNEMLTGAADARVNSNTFGPNPNVSVFEWLNGMPELKGRVAAFATWSTFKDIFNEPRSHLKLQVGFDPPYAGALTPQQKQLEHLYQTITRLDNEDNYDALMQIPLLDYLRTGRPRALFVGYGETDNWAHQGRYDLVLESAREFDDDVAQLWSTMQSMPEYHGTTTFIITCDHGRGGGLTEWKDHGVGIEGSDNVWIAVMGPDTPARGERRATAEVTQSQIAGTIAALLGKDYREFSANAAPPLPIQ